MKFLREAARYGQWSMVKSIMAVDTTARTITIYYYRGKWIICMWSADSF